VVEPTAVAIAVLTFNGRQLARDAIASLSTLSQWPLPTVVIDNGSVASEGQLLAAEFGAPVESLRLDPNRGVGGGYNAGIAWAMARGASHVLLLNNDIRVIDAAMLSRLLESTGQTVAAVAPITTGIDGLTYSAGGQLSLWTGLAKHHRGVVAEQPYSVTWLDGPCLLVSLAAVREIGPLDESLWMYWEDVEWSLRARQAGWACVVQPEAQIIHLGGGTNSRSQAEAMDHRNRFRVLRRYSSGLQFAASTAFYLCVHAPAYIARRARRGRLLASIKVVAGACLWNAREAVRSGSWRGVPPPRWNRDDQL